MEGARTRERDGKEGGRMGGRERASTLQGLQDSPSTQCLTDAVSAVSRERGIEAKKCEITVWTATVSKHSHTHTHTPTHTHTHTHTHPPHTTHTHTITHGPVRGQPSVRPEARRFGGGATSGRRGAGPGGGGARCHWWCEEGKGPTQRASMSWGAGDCISGDA